MKLESTSPSIEIIFRPSFQFLLHPFNPPSSWIVRPLQERNLKLPNLITCNYAIDSLAIFFSISFQPLYLYVSISAVSALILCELWSGTSWHTGMQPLLSRALRRVYLHVFSTATSNQTRGNEIAIKKSKDLLGMCGQCGATYVLKPSSTGKEFVRHYSYYQYTLQEKVSECC